MMITMAIVGVLTVLVVADQALGKAKLRAADSAWHPVSTWLPGWGLAMFGTMVGTLTPFVVMTSSTLASMPFMSTPLTEPLYLLVTTSACWFATAAIRGRVLPKTPMIPRRVLAVLLGIWWASMLVSNAWVVCLSVFGGLQ